MPDIQYKSKFDLYLERKAERLNQLKQRKAEAKNKKDFYDTKQELNQKSGEAYGDDAKTEEVKSLIDMNEETREEADKAAKAETKADNDNRQSVYNETANGVEGASSFGNYLASRFGVAKAPNSDRLEEQADLHDKQAADEKSVAQWNKGEANRNYRNEAEKTAVSQAHAKNDQLVAESSAVDAASALANRQIGTPEYEGTRDYMAAQKAEGAKNTREMYGAQQTAIEERAAANAENHNYNDMMRYNGAANALSMGGGATQTDGAGNNNPAPPKENTPETTAEQEPDTGEEQAQPSDASAQALMNYVQGVNNDKWNAEYQKPEVQAFIEQYGLVPAAGPEDPKHWSHGRDADKAVAATYGKFMEDYNNATGRMVGTEQQQDMDSPEALQELYGKNINETQSDARQKNIIQALGSIRY